MRAARAQPEVTVVPSVVVVEPPTVTEPEPGLAETEKSLLAGLVVIWLKIFEYAQLAALS